MGALCFTLTLSSGDLALSQVPSQKEVQTFYQNQGIISPLKAQGEIGNLVYAPVKLDGKVLLLVAVPASVSQKKDDEGASPLDARELGYFAGEKPKELLLIWLVVFLVNKGIDPLIGSLFKAWKEEVEAKILFNRASERDLVRIDALADAIKGVGTVLLLPFGLIFSLQRLGIPIAPILAGAGIVGFAVSFGSQNFIKSMILGLSNFWLDAYTAGDWIVVENVSGKVENVNLFFTQIRNIEGSLVTIPNSRIEIVENKTRDWSQVNLTLQVAYDTDLDGALTAIRQTAEELSYDPDWRQHILDPPDLLGVDNLEHSGMAVRLLLKTQPGLQWKVGRELRRRLRHRFEQEGISIGIPQQTLTFQNLTNLIQAKDNQKNLGRV
jgi:small conductance mechanosensitive channel